MKIYDCITFFNELDLLEIRMNILNDSVDHFVINEATVTFQGNEKPLYYLENKDRFKKFEHKIIHNIVDDTPPTNNNWENDVYHKACTMRALTNCSDDDIIIYSDTDEIPNSNIFIDVLKKIYTPEKLFVFDSDLYCYFLDSKTNFSTWYGSKFSNYGHLKKYSIDIFRNWMTGEYWKNNNIVHIKKENYNDTSVGWHYSWLGGFEKVKLKIESYGHTEQNNDNMKATLDYKVNNLKDIIGRSDYDGYKIKLTEQTTHKYILDNLSKYKHLLCNEEHLNK